MNIFGKSFNFKKKIFLILTLSLISSCGKKKVVEYVQLKNNSNTLQGDRTGSGGDALVCFENNNIKEIKSVELWDYVEGKALDNLNINLGSDKLSVMEKYDLFIKRLSKYDNALALKLSAYRKYAEFISEGKFSPDGQISFIQVDGKDYQFRLKDIKDANLVIELYGKNNCEIWQIARQERKYGPLTSMIKIDPRLIKKMSADHLVGLIIHEFLIKIAYDEKYNNFNNTDAIRKFNSIIASNNLETRTLPMFPQFYDEKKSKEQWIKYCYAKLYSDTGMGFILNDIRNRNIIEELSFNNIVLRKDYHRYPPHKFFKRIIPDHFYNCNGNLMTENESLPLTNYEILSEEDEPKFQVYSSFISYDQNFSLVGIFDFKENDQLDITLKGNIALKSMKSQVLFIRYMEEIDGEKEVQNEIITFKGLENYNLLLNDQNIHFKNRLDFVLWSSYLAPVIDEQYYKIGTKNFKIVNGSSIGFQDPFKTSNLKSFQVLDISLEGNINELPKDQMSNCVVLEPHICINQNIKKSMIVSFNEAGQILTALEICQ